MRYDICGLYDEQFEKLVIGICQKLLGIKVQHFSTGPDGGRDARYEGKSVEFNSTGKFIIQAKHTTNPIAKFSDNDFVSNQSSIISLEIPRIKHLFEAKQLDYYLLFSNRAMSGEAETTVRDKISTGSGLPSHCIHCLGIEMIDDYLKKHPEIPEQYGVDFIFSPLFTIPDEMASVIMSYNKIFNTNTKPKVNFELDYIAMNNKNNINRLSDDYFKYIKTFAYSSFSDIEQFLALPVNDSCREYYDDSAKALQSVIIEKLNLGYSLDEILNSIYDRLVQNDSDLKRNKKLTRIFLYYMYCNCDIGKKDVETHETSSN